MRKGVFKICSVIFVLILVLSGCSKSVDKIVVEQIPTVNVGGSHQIVYTVEPDNAKDKTVIFETSNAEIATVDANGLIKALAPGNADIYVYPAKDKDGKESKATAKVTIIVLQPVEIIECSPELSVAVGKTLSINAKVLPENASDKTLAYKSSDETVVTVDNNGTLTGIKKGGATVTVTSANGVTAECKVTVGQPVTGIKFSQANVQLAVKGTKTLKIVYIPSDADLNKNVTYSSSDNKVATVDANGKVTAVAKGTATITATAKDADGNPITATCKITVVAKSTASSGSNSGSGGNSKPSNNPPSYVQNFPGFEPSCGGCGGSGYMMTGVPCYMCDYWETH